jgi:hypothetical protein
MAFGIDDSLMAAAAAISLTDTCVKTVKAYRKKGLHIDIELLIEEVRVTALQRIDEADLALVQLERTLVERKVRMDRTLQEAISETGFFNPFEAHRLKRIRSGFNALADATYSATDDIASLVRCRNQTSEMGAAIVESANAKHELNRRLLDAKSIGETIGLLRNELSLQKKALT